MTDYGVHTFMGRGLEDESLIQRPIVSELARRAKDHPERPFLTFTDADRGRLDLSYAEVFRLSVHLAGWLTERHGSDARVNVGLLAANDPESCVAVFALLQLGHSIVFLDPSEPHTRLLELVETGRVELVVRGRSVSTLVFPESVRLPSIDDLWNSPSGPEPSPDDRADHARLIFGTSGSTGRRKLVVQSQVNAMANAEGVRRHHRLRAGQRILTCLPICHVNALHFTVMGALRVGANACLTSRFDPLTFLRHLQELQPRIASVVPSVLETLLQLWGERGVRVDLDYFLTAAAPLAPETIRRTWKSFGARVVQGYGLSETVNFSTTMPAALSDPEYERRVLAESLPSVGRALWGTEISIQDEKGRPRSPGTEGEVCIRGHSVMVGYLGDDEATRSAFRGGWFHTGDLGFESVDRRSGDRVLTLTGRLKDLVKIGGRAISLAEIERAIGSLDGVRDCGAFAVPDPLLGEAVYCAVVANEGTTEPRFSERVAQVLPRWAVPRILWSETIPRTHTGKLRRRDLKRMLDGGASSE